MFPFRYWHASVLTFEYSYRAFPGWIEMILIRKATDIAAIGIDDKNKLERFEKAFKGVPVEAWHVFEDPSECRGIVRELVRRS